MQKKTKEIPRIAHNAASTMSMSYSMVAPATGESTKPAIKARANKAHHSCGACSPAIDTADRLTDMTRQEAGFLFGEVMAEGVGFYRLAHLFDFAVISLANEVPLPAPLHACNEPPLETHTVR
jgi:hypothetical protein